MKKLLLLFAALMLSVGMAQAQENTGSNTLPTPNGNQIVYRSANHEKITPHNIEVFGATYNDADNVYDAEADYGVITFDGNVTTIGKEAFEYCKSLTEIVFPSTVTSIGEWAFYGCTGMAELTIPSTVTAIGGFAFSGWPNLTKLSVKAGTIGESAFAGCSKLNSIDLQEGVTSIRENAFQNCAGMEELTIPSTVNEIGMQAFYGLPNLIKLTVKAGSIGGIAFANCPKLSSVDLQEGVT
ncbi:MAG: leucine-rich repeat domain-containing protein, partial [Bacteroidaceae bacterium]|nr:leucine-rich repeat domain-containing protein [Bacteroidaceae bacterium]